MNYKSRRSLTSGSGDNKGEALVGIVKEVRNGPNGAEKRVKIKPENGKKGMSFSNTPETEIYVPRKYARDLKPESRYEFHLEDHVFRGGGGDNGSFKGVTMARRTESKPVEVRDSGLSGGGAGGDGFRRF